MMEDTTATIRQKKSEEMILELRRSARINYPNSMDHLMMGSVYWRAANHMQELESQLQDPQEHTPEH